MRIRDRASSYAYDAAGQLTEFLQTTGYGERYAYDLSLIHI